MTFRCHRVSSRALGHRVTVHVHIYPDQPTMRQASEAFNDEDFSSSTQGGTHAWVDADGRATHLLVHLHDNYLRHDVISHELLHAAHALYGATLNDEDNARTHFTHHNEQLAHLHTDLYSEILRKLAKERP